MKISNIIKGAFAAFGGIISAMLGGMTAPVKALLIFMVIDYITGVAKGIYTKTISSSTGIKGIIKKVMILAVVAFSAVLQSITAKDLPIRDIVVMFFAANEGISIVENAAAVIKVPDKLKEVLMQLN